LNILVTGATGFLGKHLLSHLENKLSHITVLLRTENEQFTNSVVVSRFNGDSDFNKAVVERDVIIHCAARVHVMNDTANDPLESFREVNTYGTLNLAQQAAAAGVKRFIFISSIKVNGESTELGKPFKDDYNFIPTDYYGLSKYEAEVGLRKIANETGMEVVIIRPPLVYGPGVKANFAAMMCLAAKGLPIPFGSITKNRRSLVSVYNLVDLIVNCIFHPNAANQTFLVSDDEDLSTAQMLKELSIALGKNSKMPFLPVKLFEIAGKITGKSAIVERLCGSLQVDVSKTKKLLNWQPPVSVKEGFARTAEYYLKNK
jgi:nucleoside-diphosphate-sugar epimerase